MTRRVVVHGGFHKTGSTSLQQFVAANRDALAAHVCPVMRAADPPGITQAVPMLRRAVGAAVNEGKTDAATNAMARIIDAFMASGRPTLLISDENLFGGHLGHAGNRRLYPNLGVILALLDTLLTGFDVRFLFYTREREAWLWSIYAQCIKGVHTAEPFDAFVAEHETDLTWDGLIRERVAPAQRERLSTVACETELAAPVPRTLLDHLGVPTAVRAHLRPLKRHNQAMSQEMIEHHRLFNAAVIAGREAVRERDAATAAARFREAETLIPGMPYVRDMLELLENATVQKGEAR